MAIDFTFPPEVEQVRLRVREFITNEVVPIEAELFTRRGDEAEPVDDRRAMVHAIIKLRQLAREAGLWLPHMPAEWGGMELSPTAAATVSAEAARTGLGPFVLNCQAPDEGNQFTLLNWGTPEQKDRYLKPSCEGIARSCFAMTEPEVAGSDPTLIQTTAVPDGDDWIVNGHKWFISGARGAQFAILIARTETEPIAAEAATTAFIVELPSEGWEIVRDVELLSGNHNHGEIRITNLRVPTANMLGRRGEGHLLSQSRVGPSRLGHCMRWIAQCETALDMMVERSLSRYSQGSSLADKQGVQWLIADSTMELYQAKLMVLHACYKLESGLPFKAEVSMAKHFVANSLWRIVDRAIEVHGALGYSTDTPLADMLKQARWSRLADGSDEVMQMTIANEAISAFRRHGTTRAATGDLSL